METKTCKKCKQTKPISEFYPYHAYSQDGYNPWCKECKRQEARDYRAVHPGKMRDLRLQREYGITLAMYEEMYIEQEGNCSICGTHYDKLMVDHSHITNDIRGLLCNPCNTAIGLIHEDTSLLQRILIYLTSPARYGGY
jgi:hypothetical protein